MKNTFQEVSRRLPDRVAGGGVADVVALEHGERPPVDGDVLRRSQEVEEEEHARQRQHVRRTVIPAQVLLHVERQRQHG